MRTTDYLQITCFCSLRTYVWPRPVKGIMKHREGPQNRRCVWTPETQLQTRVQRRSWELKEEAFGYMPVAKHAWLSLAPVMDACPYNVK